MKRLVGIAVACALVVGAGCGSSDKSKKKTTIPTPTTPTPTSTTSQPRTKAPKIVTFRGPSVVPCGKKGQIKTVSFRYEVANATAVSPEIDGQNPGAQAGYDPHAGTMRFNYRCPGPHRLTITAFGQTGKQASKTVTVEPESSG